MTEKNFYNQIKKGLVPLGFILDRIECYILKGVPDVLYCHRETKNSFGWIELKYLEKWPQLKTIVSLNHFTKEQRNWIYIHGKATGRVFLFLKAGKDYLIFNHEVVFTLGSCTRGELLQQATMFWHKKINYSELKKILLFL